eukprot:scaffold124871_cov25-Tisochrysis_lutea.AAC.3
MLPNDNRAEQDVTRGGGGVNESSSGIACRLKKDGNGWRSLASEGVSGRAGEADTEVRWMSSSPPQGFAEMHKRCMSHVPREPTGGLSGSKLGRQ